MIKVADILSLYCRWLLSVSLWFHFNKQLWNNCYYIDIFKQNLRERRFWHSCSLFKFFSCNTIGSNQIFSQWNKKTTFYSFTNKKIWQKKEGRWNSSGFQVTKDQEGLGVRVVVGVGEVNVASLISFLQRQFSSF